jgi:peptidoglycan/xylan/chitin deacetylase (PgdA/CDA1 family)
LNRLSFVLSSRGVKNTAARAWQVASRFGIDAARMEKRLLAYRDIVGEYGGGPSLPITAAVLDRNPQVARRLSESGVELCVHGLVHTDMARLPAATQEEHIRKAVEVFRQNGVDFEGFRSPYLKYNQATLAAVEKAGFEYDSNLPFYWEPAESLRRMSAGEAEGLARGLRFYGPVTYPSERSLPRYIGGIVEIPVSLPDDEILLDRMGLPVGRIGDVWMEMAGKALERQELLTVQLHPERVLLLESPLRRVLEFARSGGSFWIAKMRDIASWWNDRMRASVEIVPDGKGTYRVTSSGAAGLGLRVVEPLAGLAVEVAGEGIIRSTTKPVIGISGDTPPDLRRRIRELGYFIEITTDRNSVSLYLDRDVEASDLERLIGRCPKPLLAGTIWPAPYRAALTVTGDIDCLTLGDFVRRFREG